MPRAIYDWDAHTSTVLITEQLNYKPQEQHQLLDNLLPTLNHDQHCVYNAVIDCIKHSSPRLFSPRGTGKMYVYTTICAKLQSEGTIVFIVVSSGTAALLLPGGQTAYSTFKIPIDGLSKQSVCNIPKNSPHAKLLHHTNLIIWDKARMQHHYAVEALNRSMCDIHGTDQPFSGITVLFGGDWEQCLSILNMAAERKSSILPFNDLIYGNGSISTSSISMKTSSSNTKTPTMILHSGFLTLAVDAIWQKMALFLSSSYHSTAFNQWSPLVNQWFQW
jgi:hypothetical protein